MIYSLTGVLAEKQTDEIVLVCNGVGFKIAVSLPTAAAAPSVGAQWTVYTYLQVKEDGLELFGFVDKETQRVFKMLIGVSGVGPKAALSILSVLSVEKILLSISAGDYKAFTACQGVGPKLAQRLVLELKDKVGTAAGIDFSQIAAVSAANGAAAQAVQALVALGYSQGEAAATLAKLDAGLPVEELIRQALRNIAGRR